MTAKDISAIAKSIMYLLPEFTTKGSLLLKITTQATLLGLSLDGSSRDSKILRVNAFVLPLFVPIDTIHFNYGIRIGAGAGQWNADDPNLIDRLTESIRIKAIPFFNSVSTLQGVAEFIRPMVIPSERGYSNPHSQEALAYTLVALHDFDGALTLLNEIQKTLSESAVPWELDIRARTKLIELKLLQNPKTALEQLDAWKCDTIVNLKIVGNQ